MIKDKMQKVISMAQQLVMETGYNVVSMNTKGEDFSRAQCLYDQACQLLRLVDLNAQEFIRNTYNGGTPKIELPTFYIDGPIVPGMKGWEGDYRICLDLRPWFPNHSNNCGITDEIIAAGLYKGERDPESACSYFYFRSRRAAIKFVDALGGYIKAQAGK